MLFLVQAPFLVITAALLLYLYRVNSSGVLFMHGAYFTMSITGLLFLSPYALGGARNHALTYVASHLVCVWYLAVVVMIALAARNRDWTIPDLPGRQSYAALLFIVIVTFLIKLKVRIEYGGLGLEDVSPPEELPYYWSAITALLGTVEIAIVWIILRRLLSEGFSTMGVVVLSTSLVPFFFPGMVGFGTRRAIALLVILVIASRPKGMRLVSGRTSLLIFFSLLIALQYQRIRSNLFNPEVVSAFAEGTWASRSRGILLFFTLPPQDDVIGSYRTTSADYLYDVMDQYMTAGKTTGGAILVDGFKWAIPGFLIDKSQVLGSDRIVAYQLRIEGPGASLSNREFLDFSNSVLTDFIADLGFLGAILAPFVVLGLIVGTILILHYYRASTLTIYILLLANLFSAIGQTEQSFATIIVIARMNLLILTGLALWRMFMPYPPTHPPPINPSGVRIAEGTS